MLLCRFVADVFLGVFLRLRLPFLFWNSPDTEFGEAKNSRSTGGTEAERSAGVGATSMYLALILYLWCQTFRMMDLVVNTLLTLYVLIGTWLEERNLSRIRRGISPVSEAGADVDSFCKKQTQLKIPE